MNYPLWRSLFFGTFILVSAILPGCGTSNVESPPPPALVSLSLAPVNTSIAPGTTIHFAATGIYSNSTRLNLTSTVTWNSADTGIAKISNALGSQGVVTAVAPGPTTISAVFSGVTGTAAITISPVSSMTVTPSAPSIAPGTTLQFSALGTLGNGTIQDLTTFASWTSSLPAIATVGAKGLATALTAPGTASIQASFDISNVAALLTTSHVASIAVTPVSATITRGMTQQFSASGTLLDGAGQDLTTFATWTSFNPAVATISSLPGSAGLATAVAAGSAGISAQFDLATSPTASLIVTEPVLTAVTVTPASASIGVGGTQQFTATGSYSDGSALDITSAVTWLSSKTTATISNTPGSKGVATGLSQGTTTITATLFGITSNGATLTVTPAVLTSIEVSPVSASIPSGGTQQFTATGKFTDGSSQDMTKTVTWHSSDTAIATISNLPGTQGLATPFGNTGSTNITASFSGITSNVATLTVNFF